MLSAVIASILGVSLEMRALAVSLALLLLVAAVLTRTFGRRLWPLLVLVGAAYFWAQIGSAHAPALSEEPTAGVLPALSPASNFLHLLAPALLPATPLPRPLVGAA